MILRFEKYHGAGNDFILIDNRDHLFHPDKQLISALCHRRFGIGADGLMLLEPSDHYDFSMRYFNSDGGEGSMCGNGGRCITAFARHLGIISDQTHFIATDGVHDAQILSKPDEPMRISLGMKDVSNIKIGDGYYFLDTGSPHHVVFVKGLEHFDVVNEGKKIRFSPLYGDKGTNVDFAEVIESGLFVRTYERGVEDETLSCGTGVTATALVFAMLQDTDKGVDLIARGGQLYVSFKKQGNTFSNIRLEGPVVHAYTGQIPINGLR